MIKEGKKEEKKFWVRIVVQITQITRFEPLCDMYAYIKYRTTFELKYEKKDQNQIIKVTKQ